MHLVILSFNNIELVKFNFSERIKMGMGMKVTERCWDGHGIVTGR